MGHIYRAGVVGAGGYTGIELCRLLLAHPYIRIEALFAKSQAGQTFSDVYPQFLGVLDLVMKPVSVEEILSLDVVFLALPHGESQPLVKALFGSKVKVIDLSADFRLKDAAIFAQHYGEHQAPELLDKIPLGLPERYATEIQEAQTVACPGCYSTSVMLGAGPLAMSGLIVGDVLVDAKSGVSGAGRSLKTGSLFCEVADGFSAYGTGVHRHQPEMAQVLGLPVFFSPHLVPMNRGILASIYLTLNTTLDFAQLQEIYRNAYQGQPFVQLLPEGAKPSTKTVFGSNRCAISIVPFGSRVVVFSAIDNLIKGASGQAIQCMNLMLALPQETGLQAVSPYL
jgi:N-acetyl-gamma-glutamyl-phosphate reductase